MALLQSKEDKVRFFIAFTLSMGVFSIINTIFPPKIQNTKDEKGSNVNELSFNKKSNSTSNLNEKTNIDPRFNITIENNLVKATINTQNNRIVDLKVNDKKEKNGVANIISDNKFFESNFITNNNPIDLKWSLVSSNNSSLKLSSELENVKYEITYSLKDHSILVDKKVTNNSKKSISVINYDRIFKDEIDLEKNNYSYHGVVVGNGNSVKELDYKKIKKEKFINNANINNGWIGFSDQYYFLGIIPDKTSSDYNARFVNQKNGFQVDSSSDVVVVQENNSMQFQSYVISTPKNIHLLDEYEKIYNVKHLDKVIDFGMFYFISKPMLLTLYKINNFLSANKIQYSLGFAIILLTILVRVIILPLAYKSYKSMALMKDVAPEIKLIQEQYKEDKQNLHKKMLEVYKKNNISPFASMVPLFLQIPIFFAIYKVIIICPEMRLSEFFWIKDLYARDHSSIFNLFGLIPINLPEFLQLGVLPVFMGITMYLQTKLNPVQTMNMDKTQEKIMNFMPVLFTFLFASFPAGLVLYWSVSNIFTIVQQFLLMHIFHKKKNKNA
jgi:YidC/Oxa1 family membrane protein insertase